MEGLPYCNRYCSKFGDKKFGDQKWVLLGFNRKVLGPAMFNLYLKDTLKAANGQLARRANATRGLLATDHVILNPGQVTWTTPELAPPSPNYHTTPTGGRFSSRQI
ncbi:hypothetical protein TNCV_4599721 [Trichonephila clavipes]|nr:hypothetical protein TNCV_4599721 [Trichonephila clavipes]